MTFLVVVAVLLVNVFYPEWTGGWSTGPRLLVPLLPFAIAARRRSAVGRVSAARRSRPGSPSVLALAGGVEMLLFQGAAGEFRTISHDPLVQAVWPHLDRRAPSLVAVQRAILPQSHRPGRARAALLALSRRWQAIQFCPSCSCKAIGLAGLWRLDGTSRPKRCIEHNTSAST